MICELIAPLKMSTCNFNMPTEDGSQKLFLIKPLSLFFILHGHFEWPNNREFCVGISNKYLEQILVDYLYSNLLKKVFFLQANGITLDLSENTREILRYVANEIGQGAKKGFRSGLRGRNPISALTEIMG